MTLENTSTKRRQTRGDYSFEGMKVVKIYLKSCLDKRNYTLSRELSIIWKNKSRHSIRNTVFRLQVLGFVKKIVIAHFIMYFMNPFLF